MKKLLVVDDSNLVHALCRQLLGRMRDLTLSFARNGEEALAWITKEGEPDLILLDVNMPVMDGLECLRRLAAQGTSQRVPVVMVTTEGRDEDVRRGLEGGATAYLRKPFAFQELRELVTRLGGRA
ncbi:MAG TPA: response regulator [Polyangia bacterium]|jgi:CheY-like chemotaxis protein